MLTADEVGLLGLISGQRAKANVARLVMPHERIAGSDAERQGAEQAREMLAPYMDRCELEGYPARVYHRGEGHLAIVSPTQAVVRPALVNAISGTGRGTGRLVDVGGGDVADFDRLGDDVRGGVALVTLGAISDLGRLLPAATEAKQRGVGCLLYHFSARPHPSIHVSDIDLPTLTISNESAAQLRALLRQHGEVQVEYAATVDEADATSFNVVGTIIGSTWPKQVIYVTAHHDTYFEGANDNNSSIAVLLELAEVLKVRRPKRTFKFVVFGGEEGGTARGGDIIYWDRGSLAFTEEYRELLAGQGGELAVAVINGEILGYGPDAAVHCTPELAPLLWQVVADLGVNRLVMGTRGFWSGSDHLAFHTLGVPSIEMMPDEEPGAGEAYWSIYHTPLDNLGNVFPEALEANARAFALTALRLDDGEHPPLSLSNVAAVVQRDLSALPNAPAIAALIGRHVKHLEQGADGPERLRQHLAFIRTMYRHLYCFAGIGGAVQLTCTYLADTLARLREAHYLAAVERDPARARATLTQTMDGDVAARYGAAVFDALNRRKAQSPWYARWSNPHVDLREVVQLADQPDAADALAVALRGAIDDVGRQATAIGQQFERDLQTLLEGYA